MKKLAALLSTIVLTVLFSFSLNAFAIANGIVCIDSPSDGSAVNGSVYISGWSVNTSGVKSVSVYVDGKYSGKADIGKSRSDVKKAVSDEYKGAESSGYDYALNTSNLDDGSHSIKIVSYGNNGTSASRSIDIVKKSPLLMIDYPNGDSRHLTNDFYISGWSLDVSGIKKVEVTIDGKALSDVDFKRVRNDVNAIKNSSGYYKDGLHSGFNVNVDYSSLTKGTHSVTVTSIANNGTKTSKSFDIYIEEQKPITKIDSTSNGRIYINDKLTVSGFALSKAGIASVKVYVDGKFVSNAETGLASTDVNAKYNKNGFYKDGDKAKFTYTLSDISKYAQGNHTVKVVAVSKDGSEDSSTITAYKASTKFCLDSPSGTIQGNMKISGWTASAEGLGSLKIYLDGKEVSGVTTGNGRSDVKSYLEKNFGAGAYKDADKAGFNCTVPLSNLSNGKHAVKIVAKTAVTNTEYSTTRTVTVKKVSPKSHLDYPTDSGYFAKGMLVQGWSVNASGIKEVNVYINNTFVCKAECGQSRADVNRVINSSGCYKDADKSGFSVVIPDSVVDKYKSGSYTIKTVSIGYDGETCSSSSSIKKASPRATLDCPSSKISYTDGGIYVSGWSTSASGIKKVEVYVDNKFVGNAEVGSQRNDVNKAVNSSGKYYDAQHSGFSAVIANDKITNLYSGSHNVKIISYGFDGETATAQNTVGKASPHMHVDLPSGTSGILNNGINVSGWAVGAAGIKSIDIYIDGKYVESTTTSFERSDVSRLYSSNDYYNLHQSGFKVTVPYSKIADFTGDTHTVKVVAVGNDGVKNSSTKTFNKVGMRSNIDTPVNGSDYINNSLWVSGWAVAQSGIKKAEVYIDGTFVGNAEVGRVRNDVNKSINSSGVYYDAAHSGFGYDVPEDKLKTLKNGNHTVKVICFANDGETITKTATISKLASKFGFDSGSITVTGNTNIKGFALSSSGVTSIVVKYGDKTVNLTSSQFNLSSSDIKSKYDSNGKKYANSDTCRFSAPIDVSSLSIGKNSVKFIVTEANGTENTYTATVTRELLAVSNGRLDSPTDGYVFTFADTSTNVSGWALIKSGIEKVEIKLDGKAIAAHKDLDAEQAIIDQAASAGVSAEIAAKARFNSDDIDLTKLSYGSHKIEVVIYANDGSVYKMQSDFTKVAERYQNYNITLANLAKKVAAAQTAGNVTVSFDGDNIKYISPTEILKNSYGVYEFMTLNWVDGITAADINKMLVGRGVLEGKGQAFIDAGKQYNINPVYLAAHARIESGNGTSTLSKGVTIDGKKYYNQYGIGAVDSNPVTKGSQYAKTKGWDTVEKSIIGGAEWIKRNYIWGGNPNQYTLYLMRFNPGYFDGTNKTSSCYCYATAKNWANGIASIIYDYRDIFAGKDINFEFPKFQ